MANDLDFFRSRRFNRFFDDFLNAFSEPSGEMRTLAPPFDVRDEENRYLLSFEIPGVPRKDITVELQGNRLHIAGKRHVRTREEGMKKDEYVHFERFVMLPDDVDPSKIEADYEDGVLCVAVPRAVSGEARKVEVGSGNRSLLGRRERAEKEGEKPTGEWTGPGEREGAGGGKAERKPTGKAA